MRVPVGVNRDGVAVVVDRSIVDVSIGGDSAVGLAVLVGRRVGRGVALLSAVAVLVGVSGSGVSGSTVWGAMVSSRAGVSTGCTVVGWKVAIEDVVGV